MVTVAAADGVEKAEAAAESGGVQLRADEQ